MGEGRKIKHVSNEMLVGEDCWILCKGSGARGFELVDTFETKQEAQKRLYEQKETAIYSSGNWYFLIEASKFWI